MNDRAVGKNGKQFRKNLFQEFFRFGISEAEFLSRNSRIAGILRIGGKESAGVPRNVDFRYDPDIVPARKLRHFAEIVRRILSRRERCQIRELRNEIGGDAPALPVRQVPVERIQAEMRHQADHCLDRFLALEMPCAVQHESAPSEPGFVAGGSAVQNGARGPLISAVMSICENAASA